MVALNYGETELHQEKVSNIKPFMNKYDSIEINCFPKIDHWKTFEKNYSTIALNFLYIQEKGIYPAYIWKTNSNCEKEKIRLMIPNDEKEDIKIKKKKIISIITWSSFRT